MTTTADLAEHASRHLTERVGGQRLDRAARRLSIVAGLLMAIAAGAGLVAKDLYRDADGLRHMLRGHDFITLVVVVPLLAWGLHGAGRGDRRARFVWLGTLAYATYNYAVYVLGTGFNELFLVHTVILEASAVALVLGLLSTETERASSVSRRSGRVAAGLLLFLAVGLAAMWIFNALRFAITGETPSESELVLPLATVHLGYALDLTLIVPSYALAAVLLWRGAAWGYVLGPVLLVGGLLQQLTYLAALGSQHRADLPGATAFDPGEPVVILVYAAGLWLLMHRPTIDRRT